MNFDLQNTHLFEILMNRNIGAINVRILQVEATMLLCMHALFVRNLHNSIQLFGAMINDLYNVLIDADGAVRNGRAIFFIFLFAGWLRILFVLAAVQY